MQQDVVKISVRNLVEFILRSGDIDNRIAGMPDQDAMQLGSRLHRKIQAGMGSDYRSEVPLKMDFACDDFLIRVEGRADGIIEREHQTRDAEGSRAVTIDEIKGVVRSLATLTEPVPVHLAQAKCYAYFYACEQDLEQIDVRMSYAHLETEEMKYFQFRYEKKDLEAWFMAILEEYQKWARFERSWKAARQDAIRHTQFPFPYREGQKQLAQDVYRSIYRGRLLFIQAPTGVGKTLSTLFPAVKAMGENLGDKIFYLTARTITRTAAAQALDQLRGNGLRLKSVVLTAKEKICKCEETLCNPDDCPYARGHFDRINQAVYTLINEEDVFDRELIDRAADRFMVCPFELSLDLSTWMDAVIGDYNYAFHPRSRLKRFFADGVKGDYLFLIDEAHNLVDRGRDMFSAELIKEDFLALRREVREYAPKLARALERVNKRFLELKKQLPEEDSASAGEGSIVLRGDRVRVLENLGTLPLTLMNLYGTMDECLREESGRMTRGGEAGRFLPPLVREHILDLFFSLGTFLNTCDLLDENYVIYDEIEEDGRFRLKLYCVNPASNLQSCMDKARSSVLFSATLLPIDYYRQLLCTRTDCYAVYAKSVFDPARLKVLTGSSVSSRYTRRSSSEFARIAGYIMEAVTVRSGNYMVFFPSYRMLEDVAGAFEALSLTMENAPRMICQSSGMREKEREEFLEQFSADREDTLVGFCVMGSFFGEGIDLKEDRLIGAIIVGTGLPMVCAQQEILRQYYEKRGQDGFRFAYQCPGMNKVLQAAGRVIRTEEDTGVVLLLDERFLQQRYRQMFPREWGGPEDVAPGRVREALTDFWLQSQGTVL